MRIFLGLGLFLGAWLAAAACSAGVTAEITPQEIELGEATLLRVTVDGDTPATVDVRALAPFLVTPRGRAVGATSQAGQGGLVTVYRFELTPKRAGELPIPPLPVTVGEQTFHTPELHLLVQPKPTPPPDLTGREFALDAVVSNDTPYVGEQFRYTLRLFRSQAVEAAAVTPPDFPGFTAVALPGQRDSEIVSRGRHYAVTEVDYILTPTRPGRVDLEPGSAACRQAVDPKKNAGAQSKECSGPPRTVTVLPLPPFPGPGTWSGLVGQARLTARVELPGPGVGPRPTLVVTLSGQGNLPDVAPPPLTLPGGVTAHMLTPEDAGTYGPTGYQGSRTFRALLAAMPPDGAPWPTISLTLFDPETEKYRTLQAVPEVPQPTPTAAAAPVVPPLRLAPESADNAAPPAWYWILLLALAAPGIYGVDRWRYRRNEEAAFLAGLSPAALAEALRHAQTAPGTVDAAAVAHALGRLEALLYSGHPANPGEHTAAMDAGRCALRAARRRQRRAPAGGKKGS